MRKVEIGKHEFAEIVWPAVHRLPAKDVQENGVVVGLSKKLKAVGQPRPLNEREQKAEDEGQLVFPDYVVDGAVELLLEDEEWRLLKDRVKKWLPNLTGYAAQMFGELLERIESAEKIEPEG